VTAQERLRIEIESSTSWRPVPYGKGRALPARFTSRIDRTGWPLLELQLVVEGGEARCERLAFLSRPQDKPITATVIRKVQVREAIHWSIRSALLKVEPTPRGGWKLSPVGDDVEGMALQKAAVMHARRRSGSERSATPEDQARAVRLVERERKRGPDAVKRVADRMGFSRATVYRLLRRARGEE
jgi:hypothetical protein